MSNLGAPVAYLVLPDDVPVYDGSGAQVGRVAQVLADEAADIFHGVVVRLPDLPPRYRFVDPAQIGGIFERGVVLAVAAEQMHDPSEDAVAAHAVGGDTIREGLRRALEWMRHPT